MITTTNKYEQLSKERKRKQVEGTVPEWYTTPSWQMFSSSYSHESEMDVLDRHMTIAKTWSQYMPDPDYWCRRFFDLLWSGKYSPASPALANTGLPRGQDVSCSGQYIGDNVNDWYESMRVSAALFKNSFGGSGVFDIRERGSSISNGGIASGSFPIVQQFFQTAALIKQGNRRGAFAAYIDISNNDWYEHNNILRKDQADKHYGWIYTDSFIDALKAGCPEANFRLSESIYTKCLTGKGYYFGKDKANRHRPQMYKDLGLDVKASNLCTEIMLHSSREYDFSCILGSMNLIHLDSFMKPNDDSIFVATIMLDCAVSAFLDKSKGVPGLEKVRAFTEKGRAVGLGILGLSTYLQMKNIPYESIEAQFIDLAFAKKLHDETLRASQFLAKIHGEPEWCKGYGVRNTHRTAIAPTKSTSILMGCVSESWLPDPLMIFDADSAVGEIRRIPPAFLAKMKERGVFNDKTISELIKHNGSAQKCGFLTPHEKLVFKNAYEIDNHLYIRRAGLRQKYICQGQALNCFIPENASEDYVSSLVTHALLNPNVLSLYYFYFKNGLIISDECVNCHA